MFFNHDILFYQFFSNYIILPLKKRLVLILKKYLELIGTGHAVREHLFLFRIQDLTFS